MHFRIRQGSRGKNYLIASPKHLRALGFGRFTHFFGPFGRDSTNRRRASHSWNQLPTTSSISQRTSGFIQNGVLDRCRTAPLAITGSRGLCADPGPATRNLNVYICFRTTRPIDGKHRPVRDANGFRVSHGPCRRGLCPPDRLDYSKRERGRRTVSLLRPQG